MRELVLHCREAQAEALSDALLAAGALSVCVEDADEGGAGERPLFGEPGAEPVAAAWDRNRVAALLPDGADPAQLLEAALAGSGLPGRRELAEGWSLREVPDADWVRLTQSQFGPIEISSRLWIVPSWCKAEDSRAAPGADAPRAVLDANMPRAAPGPDALCIELDPGLAFGTGSHPTTHLCLSWLESELPAGASVLDYGCGSGILAIAACKLGAGPVSAVDIDPQAVQSTRDNARVNRAGLQAMLPDALPEGEFDAVVANILSNPLKVLAPMLASRVAPGGHLALSGVLRRQAEDVAAAYAPWLALSVWRERDGWVCLSGRKGRPPVHASRSRPAKGDAGMGSGGAE
jgi:ribosomal protein L11 methyltransferase